VQEANAVMARIGSDPFGEPGDAGTLAFKDLGEATAGKNRQPVTPRRRLSRRARCRIAWTAASSKAEGARLT
jgi:hypothetical protein